MQSHNNLVPVGDRILLHLLQYQGSKQSLEANAELSQNGIAEAVGTHRSYIPRPIKDLVAKGLIKEEIGRIKGGKRKQKYYLLTDEGKKHAQKMMRDIAHRPVTLILSDVAEITMPFTDVISYLGENNICTGITEMDIFRAASEDAVLDCLRLIESMKIQYIDHSLEAPRVMRFFGRKKEKSLLEKWLGDLEGNNIIFLHGIAGIGKTTLAAKLIEKYRGSKHLFWHNFHDLDSLRGVLFKLSEFLSKLGENHLEMHLRTRTILDYHEVSKILKKSMGAIDAIVVFDDFHKSKDQIRDFFVYILRMLSPPSKTKMLILSREIVPFYDSRDVISRNIVAELELEGLDFESSKKLLREKGVKKNMFREIYGLTAGNPLFLEIYKTKDHLERYVHDELFSKLEDREREVLGLLSIYNFPIPEDTMGLIDDFDFETLYLLTQKSIVKKDAQNRYFVHDIIKQFFHTRLSPSKKRKQHLLATQWYGDRDEPIERIEAIYHYYEAGEHVKAVQYAIENASMIIDGGYAGEFLGILERLDERNVEPDLWSELLIVKGKACYMGGEWKKALLFFNRSSDMASVIGNHEIRVKATCETGHILEEQNQLDRAMASFKKALELSKKADYPLEMGQAYRGIGRVHWRKSEHKEAIQNYKKCLEISEMVNDLELLASTHIDLGNVYDEMHEREKAIECYNKSIDILKETKNASERARAYGNLAIMYVHLGEFEKAIEYGNQHLELAKKLHDLKIMGYGYAGLSHCYAKINDLENARIYVKKAEDIASKIDNENIMYQVNKTYAQINKHEHNWEKAVNYLKKNIEAVEVLDSFYTLSDSHYELGLLFEEMGDEENAKMHFEIATNLYKELGHGKVKSTRG
jgi:tetratricopeptide (TPR) repeat protein/DNA-binding MarR family transcriptional regulator